MAKTLNDTALTILTNAAGRDNRRVLPLPELKAPSVAVQKTITKLLANGLIEEISTSRDDETDGNTTLIVITAAGLNAIGMADETVVSGHKPAKRATRRKVTLRGTKAAKRAPRARVGDTKQDAVIALLRRQQGASIEEMMAATDWQAHSVRGFMSGALKNRLGLAVVSEKDEKTGERRYYVAALKPK